MKRVSRKNLFITTPHGLTAQDICVRITPKIFFWRASMTKHVPLAAALFLCAGAFAQEGGIGGSVTDPSGAAVTGATVTVTDTGSGYARTTLTDSQGHYVVPALRPATYSVGVQSAGLRKYAQTGIVVGADQRVTVN